MAVCVCGRTCVCVGGEGVQIGAFAKSFFFFFFFFKKYDNNVLPF